MTNEEAMEFLDNLEICINEHPVVAGWLVEIATRKTENSSEKPNNSTTEDCSDVGKEQAMSKKRPCGLDYCPQEEIVGAYASCSACAWGNDDDEYERAVEQTEHDMLYEPTYNSEDGSM